MQTCKELTKLASRACDEPISLSEKLTLKLHLMMCKHCRNFAKNNAKLQQILQSHRQADQ